MYNCLLELLHTLPQEHFLKWVTIHRPQTYNELLREYNDFCKDNTEKANIL